MVHIHKSFLSIIWLLATLASLSSAFVPNSYAPPAGNKPHLMPSYEAKTLQHDLVQPFLTIRASRRSNALPNLNSVVGVIGEIFRKYGDLYVGTFTLGCAVTPYMLGLFFPKFWNNRFFFPVYKTETELVENGQDKDLAKSAESMWKCMYASLGFLLVLVTFLEANTFTVSLHILMNLIGCLCYYFHDKGNLMFHLFACLYLHERIYICSYILDQTFFGTSLLSGHYSILLQRTNCAMKL